MLSINEFIKVANSQTTGQGTTPEALIYRQSNEQIFNKLQIRISFGLGRATNIPWIAFLGYNQKVPRGIYPVLLYYKDFNLLILAYGVSENNEPTITWPNTEALTTIRIYFEKEGLEHPRKYGNSFIFKVYPTDQTLNEDLIQTEIIALINFYHSCFNLSESNAPSIESGSSISKQNKDIHNYDFANDIDKPFISLEDFESSVDILKRKKNIVLQGPPGVGKTFIARKIAYQIMHDINDSHIEMVQFHQSYSYEDFIQGLRPTALGFKVLPGVFYRFCEKAISHPDKLFFFRFF